MKSKTYAHRCWPHGGTAKHRRNIEVLCLKVRRRLAAFAALAYQVGMAKKNKRTGRHADHGAAGASECRKWKHNGAADRGEHRQAAGAVARRLALWQRTNRPRAQTHRDASAAEVGTHTSAPSASPINVKLPGTPMRLVARLE